jgi:hypothetical protein
LDMTRLESDISLKQELSEGWDADGRRPVRLDRWIGSGGRCPAVL